MCCQNRNRVCRYCIELLTVPLCPFCRTRIQGLPERTPEFRGASSLDISEQISFFDSSFHFVNPLDDSYLDSRILRRHMKRLRKLQERERQVERNRRLNIAFNEWSRQQRQQERDLQEHIKEERELFYMEHDDDVSS
jgi:hypothetical protein